jgi:hypothetical protein
MERMGFFSWSIVLHGKNSNNNYNSVLETFACESVAAVTHLVAEDMVVMRDNCIGDFYHAVRAGAAGSCLTNKDNDATSTGGERISLVLKRALDRGGGKRGHGLAGEGRRRATRHAVSSGSSLTPAATPASSRTGGGGGSRELSQSSRSSSGNSNSNSNSNNIKRGGKSKSNNPDRSNK